MKLFYCLLCSLLFSFQVIAQKYFTGLIFDDESYNNSSSIVIQSRRSFEDLPDSASLKPYCPKPGNQIQLNTSVAWATAWGARTILEAKRNNWKSIDTITRNAFSPIFQYQLVRSNEDEKCTMGSKMDDLLLKMKNTGTVKYVNFLEFCPTELPNELLVSAKNQRISDYGRLFDTNVDDRYKINSIKKSLSEGFPVVVGMHCPPSFLKADDLWRPIELMNTIFPGHALCVVGYHDSKFGGAFEVMNSWGRKWGNGGFTWIRYDDFSEFVRYAYQVVLEDDSHQSGNHLTGTVQVVIDEYREVPFKYHENGRYVLNRKFKEGDNFRIRINDVSKGYFYIIGSGEGNDFVQLYPHKPNITPSLIYPINNISIPDEQHFIQVTGDGPEDHLYLIFSKEPLDIGYWLPKLQAKTGKSEEIIYEILGNKIVSKEDVKWDKLEMSFDANFKNGEMVLMTINFKHN